MKECIMVLPTHSNYLDITNLFIKLLKKNWPNCPFKIVISVTGDKPKQYDNIETIYNGSNASLIDCIVNVANKYPNCFYTCFLGDAFISKKVNDDILKNIFDSLFNDNIDYCSLCYEHNYKKEKKYNDYLRYINYDDRYSHSFVAFFANYKYIKNEFLRFENDLDFEKYYLRKKGKGYYSNHLIIRKNYLNIIPGINKGKWDYLNYKKIRKLNSDIFFDKRIDKCGLCNSIIYHTRSKLIYFVPNKVRVFVKKVLKRIGWKFAIDD